MAKRAAKAPKRAEVYQHEEQAVLRPEVGTQAQFKKRSEPKRYRYDDSLSPALDWDGQNGARGFGRLAADSGRGGGFPGSAASLPEPRSFRNVKVAGLADAVGELKLLGKPFPQLGRQGRTPVVRRPDASAVRT